MEVAVDQWRPAVETEVEETVEVGLQARQPRRQSSITGDIDISSNTGAATVIHGPRKGDDGDEEPSANSTYLDINGGALEDLDIPKILNAVQYDIANEKGETETSITSSSSEEGSEVIDEEIVEEEVVELEFENAIPKLHTHTMHCPNCDSHITKVVLRRKLIRKGSTRITKKKEDPDNLCGCLSCFSLFIPTGDGCFNPFSIFSNKPDSRDVTKSQEDNGNCFSIFRIFKGGPTVTTNDYVDQPSPIPDQAPVKYVENNPPIQEGEIDGSNVEEESTSRYTSKHSRDVSNLGVNPPQEDKLNINVVPGILNRTEIFPKDDTNKQEGNDGSNVEGETSGPKRSLKTSCSLKQPEPDTRLDVPPDAFNTNQDQTQIQESSSFEILKSIIYGGLMEVIASLSIVVSASASGATTLNIIALAFANLIGGIIVIGHNLWDLRDDCYKISSPQNKCKELLGEIKHFPLHAFIAILSFLVFGIIPPLVYGYSFHETSDKDLTVIVVAVASLLCVGLLAIFKAYIDKCNGFFRYVKVILYYVTIAVSVSGVSYVAGNLVSRLIEELGLFDQTGSGVVNDVVSRNPSLAYY